MTRNKQNSNSSLSFLSQHSLRLTNQSLHQTSTSIASKAVIENDSQIRERTNATPQPVCMKEVNPTIIKSFDKSAPKTARLIASNRSGTSTPVLMAMKPSSLLPTPQGSATERTGGKTVSSMLQDMETKVNNLVLQVD